MKNKVIDDVVIEALANLCAQVKLSGGKNLQDRNVYSEEFIGHLLNKILSLKLENLNTYADQNIAGIDLGDETAGLAIQVTSTKTREKIESAIDSFEKYHLPNGCYRQLKVVLLIDERPNYRNDFACKGHTFTKDDVMSLAEIHTLINQMDISDRQAVADFLEDWFNTDSSSKITYEIYVLKSFFQQVAQFSDEIDENSEFDGLSEDDLKRKQERFDKFWDHIETVYSSIVDEKLEATFGSITSTLEQGDRNKIRKYLKYKSSMLLLHEVNPVQVIEQLKQIIIADLKMRFISETQVINFLYYHFFRCNVLPNPAGSAV